jgi:hypothetical protein
MLTDTGVLDRLAMNASEGRGSISGPLASDAIRWILGNAPPPVRPFLRPLPPADPSNWADERVGWGLVLLDRPDMTPEQMRDLADVEEPIRQLVADRSAKASKPVPVFRYRPNAPDRFRLLRDYRNEMDVAVTGSPQGIAPGAVPRFMLIHAEPAEIPWEMQFILNSACAVGRLHLRGVPLANYVSALLRGWSDEPPDWNRILLWSVDLGSGDITRLMRNAIAAPLHARFATDPDIGDKAVFLDGSRQPARVVELVQQLTEQKPALIVTTSHGRTGPLGNVDAMRRSLGLPEDSNFDLISPETLLQSWDAYGAVWYAHACCSAGSDDRTRFKGLLDANSDAARVLDLICQVGAMVAPLPTALLGNSRPARAFVGHVEPTFDYTIRDPRNEQFLTAPLIRALYDNLYQPWPVGVALRDVYAGLGTLHTAYDASEREFNRGQNTGYAMLLSLLTARDLESTVILGDPTACFGARSVSVAPNLC